ncbi:MAG TPA: alkaline phosphatase family protein [Gammaproteobacteria bacterium]|nr:alkaline phosphatase family protein [Gammaproteobacteria bacterium]
MNQHPLLQRLTRLGPLAPLLAFAIPSLLLFSLDRLMLTLIHLDDVSSVKGALWLFPVGLRMDSIILSALLIVPGLLLLLLPYHRLTHWLVAGLFGLLTALIIYLEATTYTFLSVYNARPNHLFVDYMSDPKTVLDIVLTNYPWQFFFGLLLMAAGGAGMARLTYHLMRQAKPWPYWQRLLATPLLILVLALGVRSSLSDSPANLGSAAFSDDHLVNELALNSSYAVAYATYRFFNQDHNFAKQYGHMEEAEIIRRVQQQTGLPEDAFDDPEIPLSHKQAADTALEKRRNLVIILAESFSAEFVGSLGGLPLSPHFDALAKQGVLFDNLYATGNRTNRGVESVLTGALPLPFIPAIKLRLAQSDFFTLPALLKAHQYQTSFIYGGDANFDNMQRFLRYNGVNKFIEGRDIQEARYRNHWGVSDQDLFATANAFFRRQAASKQPFASIILTLSNHEPFKFPEGDYELYEQPRATQHNAARYADYALGGFFAQARKEDYFNNTVFLVVADHGVEIRARGLIPAAKYHIPALILAPDLSPRRISTLASQIDLPPTVLGLLGISTRHPMPGRNLLSMPSGLAGRAIYHLGGTYAYQVENQVLLLRPNRAPSQYRLQKGQLAPITLNNEMARDALAHLLLPDLLHRQQRYRLPPQP